MCSNVLLFVTPSSAVPETDFDVRWDKVQSLKAAIDSGKYCVDSGAVADKIIVSMMEARADCDCHVKAGLG